MQLLLILILFLLLAGIGFSAQQGWLGPGFSAQFGPVLGELTQFLRHPPAPWDMVLLTVLALAGILLLIRLVRWSREFVV